MQDRQAPSTVDASPSNGRNRRSGIPLRPVDRSHLLRRGSEFPFPLPHSSNGMVRIRRERRVCDAFSGMRPLARSTRDRS